MELISELPSQSKTEIFFNETTSHRSAVLAAMPSIHDH
jgi:hypothetical protein